MSRTLPLLALLAAPALAAVDPLGPDTAFEEIGLVRPGFVSADGAEHPLPAEAHNVHDPATGARVDPTVQHRGRRGCFMHPPYLGGAGETFQEFTLRLPASPAGRIEGLTALAEKSDSSDGVTFRVRVDGAVAWSEHRNGRDWQPFAVDLAAWTGREVRVRFEVSPGPAQNTAFDWALWGDRRLRLPGYAGPAPRPDPPPLDLARLSSRENGSWAPLSGFDGNTAVDLRAHEAVFTYRGADGVLAYTWVFPTNDAASFGALALHAAMAGDKAVDVPLAGDARIEWTGAAAAGAPSVRRRGDAVECARAVSGGSLVLRARLEQKSLVCEVACDAPVIAAIDPGNWGPVPYRRPVAVPYCWTAPEYLPAENLFVARYADWTASSASHFSGARAVYEPWTDGTRNPARERFVFAAAWHLDEVLPNIPNPPSPWREDLGRRIVLDIWDGGPFARVAEHLDALAAAGVRDDLILLHVWQRDGYDNGLPAHWPAREAQGGDAGMRALSETARRLGHRLALHENYIDYYPNYERFATNDVSLDSTGGLVKAWLNEGTGIQSFAVKPSAILRLSREQTPELHRRYGTTAGYLDVHSCVPPWFHVDQRAGEPGAGDLQAVYRAHRDLWAYHRDVHRGPVAGEGNGHAFWSGWLDGVEAQFGTGWPWGAGWTAPLLADFNLLRVHPLQLNHGQGYYDRWHGKAPPWGGGLPMVALDRYRMQEIVFGHAGFLGAPTWDQPRLAWLEQHLVAPVTARHAGDRVCDIRYFVDGRWADATAAAKAGRFDRVRIAYARGLTITANGSDADWSIDGHVLPSSGWIATDRGFLAGTVRRGGVVVDLVDAPDLRLANARRWRDWRAGGPEPVTVRVAEFQALENRTVRFSYAWNCGAPQRGDLRVFVHFDAPAATRDGWKTVAQQDHRLPRPATGWTNGTALADGPYDYRVPEALADGRYAWFIGLWDDAGRLAIEGADDGQSRIRLGDLVVADAGRAIRFEPAPPAPSRAEWFTRNLNTAEAEVDFGFVKTAGTVLLRRAGGGWRAGACPPAN